MQLGWHITLPIVLRGDDEARESAADELAWVDTDGGAGARDVVPCVSREADGGLAAGRLPE